MLTLAMIHALSPHGLHEAIAVHCAGWVPTTPQEHARSGSTHQAPDGGLYCLLNYTGEWEETMALAWRFQVSAGVTNEPGTWVAWADRCPGALPQHATSEAELRRVICELALFRAAQNLATDETGSKNTKEAP